MLSLHFEGINNELRMLNIGLFYSVCIFLLYIFLSYSSWILVFILFRLDNDYYLIQVGHWFLSYSGWILVFYLIQIEY